jgi:hypothetical protein
MIFGHIALGIYSLSLTIGIYILFHLSEKDALFEKVITWILVGIEVTGIICVLYHLGNMYITDNATALSIISQPPQ